ncbi:MAG: MucBP domain-containing protein [Aristaeellaceae bacterium]
MRRFGGNKLRQLMGTVLSLLMLLAVVPASAQTPGWENVTVSVIWTDASGNRWETPAVSVPEEYGVSHGWWVTLPPEYLGSTLELQILHENPAYTYWLNDFTLQLYWSAQINAQDLSDAYAQYVGYSENGVMQTFQMQDCMKLYLSTLQPPFEVDAAEGTTGEAILLPGGSGDHAAVAPVEPDTSFDAQVSVPVYYRYENGQTIDMTETILGVGTHTVWPESPMVGGLELVGDPYGTVTVYADGRVSVNEVVFTYREPYVAPAEATLQVQYVHEDGWLIDQQTKTLSEGTHTIRPESSLTGGYELTSDGAVTVTVDAYGGTSTASVTFYYRDAYVAPAEATLQVQYVHEDGWLIDQQTKTLSEGTHTIRPESSLTGGYELTSDGAVTVTVDAYGGTSTASVTFYYRDAYVAPVMGRVTVIHQERGGAVIEERTEVLEQGEHVIAASFTHYGSLELVGDISVRVSVDGNGNVSPNPVVFTYELETTMVRVEYFDTMGNKIATDTVAQLPAGTYRITPEPTDLPAGYELVSDEVIQVNVYPDGSYSPSEISFWYRPAVTETEKPTSTPTATPTSAPKQAEVVIQYFDLSYNEVASRQTMTLSEGTHWIQANPVNLAAGYELISDAAIAVTVYADGTYSPEEISFIYAQAIVEAVTPTPSVTESTASIIVRYLDSRGNAIAQEQTVELVNGTNVVAPDMAHVPAGYEIFEGMPTSVTVQVTGGRPNQQTVSFYFAQIKQTTTFYPVTIYYYDTYGHAIATAQTKQLEPGTHWIEPQPVDLPAGYELASEAGFTLTVAADGSLDRAAEDVAFWYSPVQTAPKTATVSIQYVDSNGRVLAGTFLQELTGGQTHTLQPEPSLVPEGYDPASAKAVEVVVSQSGYAQPSNVQFTLELMKDTAVIPAGQEIARYGVVNGVDVAFRTEPSTANGNKTIIFRAKKGSSVYMVASEYNDKGELWTKVIIDGRQGYMQTKFIDMLTQKASEVYAQSVGATPVPTMTPVPTATPTEQIVEVITPAPSTAAPYAGYAMTISFAPLRTGMNAGDETLQYLDISELVIVRTQLQNASTGISWSLVQTLGGVSGYVETSRLQPISESEAAYLMKLWQQQNATPVPTVLVTNTPEPEQQQGYAYTVTDGVPFRQMPSEQSRVIDYLPVGTVAYISGQTYSGGRTWHSVAVNGEWGYIREDMIRLMSLAEEDAYLNSLYATPTPTLATTNRPYDESGLSSYGYVDISASSSVNFRESASKQSRKLGELKQYAMCLVLDTKSVNGATWYYVDYGGTQGYIHGDYFKHMTIREYKDFLSNGLYEQGIRNNSSSKPTGDLSGGVTVPSVEDQIAGSDDDFKFEFSEFVSPVTPIPNIVPTATPTLEPILLPGQIGTPEPTDRLTGSGGMGTGNNASDLAMPENSSGILYPAADQSGGGSGIVWIIVIALLLVAGGGAVVFVQHQRKRRRMALRAAQRRAQAARSSQQRPYGAQPQNRTGVYPQQSTYQSAFPQNQYARQTQANGQQMRRASGYDAAQTDESRPYARKADGANSGAAQPTAETQRKPGRRTAYQQALAEQNRNGKKDEDQ